MSDLEVWQQILFIYVMVLWLAVPVVTVYAAATSEMEWFEALCMWILGPILPIVGLGLAISVIPKRLVAYRNNRALKKVLKVEKVRDERLSKQKLI